MPETTSSLSMILPSSRVNRLGKLAEPDLGTLGDDGDIFDTDRGAVLGNDDRLGDVLRAVDESDGADIDLLQSLLE